MKKQFPEKVDLITNKTIRKDICNYYEKVFRSGKSKNPESVALASLSRGSLIENRLFQLYTFGSVSDRNGNFRLEMHNIDHQLKVCEKSVWGEEVDIVVACIIYNINIVVFSLLPSSKYSAQPVYRILTYKNSDDLPTCYLHLKMDGDSSHYEAMYSKSSNKMSLLNRTEKVKAKSKSKSRSKTIAPSMISLFSITNS
jgi:hypothetical protein